jgi:hypothetical protein
MQHFVRDGKNYIQKAERENEHSIDPAHRCDRHDRHSILPGFRNIPLEMLSVKDSTFH